MKFGNVILETDRLLIRSLGAGDVHDLFDLYSDENVIRHWGMAPAQKTSEMKTIISDAIKADEKGISLSLAVVEKKYKKLIGNVTLFNINEQSLRAEVGYLLNRRYWKKGFMTEALLEVIDFCFNTLKFRRFESDVNPENVASIQLLKKVGFEKEGYLKGRWLVDGQEKDSEIYGLLKPNFNKL